METITGKITKKDMSSGVSAKSGKPYVRWVFEINDKKYSTFEATIGEKFNVGEDVEMTGSQVGQYWNMIDMVKALDEGERAKLKKPTGSQAIPSTNMTTTDNLLRQILVELKDISSHMDKQ